MTDQPALKPCPFCPDGGRPDLISGPVYLPKVKCDDCGAESGDGENDFEAVEVWNRRAPRFTEEQKKALVSILPDEGGMGIHRRPFNTERAATIIRAMLEEDAKE